MSKAAVRFEVRLTSDEGDVYGWAMGWWFAIADVLYVYGENIPAEWKYSPGVSARTGDVPDSYEAQLLSDLLAGCDITADDMRYWGMVLLRYVDVCSLAGRSY